MRTTQFLITVHHADDADVDALESALMAQVEDWDTGLSLVSSRPFGFETHDQAVYGPEDGD